MMSLLETEISEILLLLFYFSPILLYDVIDDMICMVNTDAIFTSDYVDIEVLSIFSSWKVYSKRVSSSLTSISKRILLCVFMMISYVSIAIKNYMFYKSIRRQHGQINF